jgi:hypothetical protein
VGGREREENDLGFGVRNAMTLYTAESARVYLQSLAPEADR